MAKRKTMEQVVAGLATKVELGELRQHVDAGFKEQRERDAEAHREHGALLEDMRSQNRTAQDGVQNEREARTREHRKLLEEILPSLLDQIVPKLDLLLAVAHDHKVTLGEHGKILGEHGKILSEHGRLLTNLTLRVDAIDRKLDTKADVARVEALERRLG